MPEFDARLARTVPRPISFWGVNFRKSYHVLAQTNGYVNGVAVDDSSDYSGYRVARRHRNYASVLKTSKPGLVSRRTILAKQKLYLQQ